MGFCFISSFIFKSAETGMVGYGKAESDTSNSIYFYRGHAFDCKFKGK